MGLSSSDPGLQDPGLGTASAASTAAPAQPALPPGQDLSSYESQAQLLYQASLQQYGTVPNPQALAEILPTQSGPDVAAAITQSNDPRLQYSLSAIPAGASLTSPTISAPGFDPNTLKAQTQSLVADQQSYAADTAKRWSGVDDQLKSIGIPLVASTDVLAIAHNAPAAQVTALQHVLKDRGFDPNNTVQPSGYYDVNTDAMLKKFLIARYVPDALYSQNLQTQTAARQFISQLQAVDSNGNVNFAVNVDDLVKNSTDPQFSKEVFQSWMQTQDPNNLRSALGNYADLYGDHALPQAFQGKEPSWYDGLGDLLDSVPLVGSGVSFLQNVLTGDGVSFADHRQRKTEDLMAGMSQLDVNQFQAILNETKHSLGWFGALDGYNRTLTRATLGVVYTAGDALGIGHAQTLDNPLNAFDPSTDIGRRALANQDDLVGALDPSLRQYIDQVPGLHSLANFGASIISDPLTYTGVGEAFKFGASALRGADKLTTGGKLTEWARGAVWDGSFSHRDLMLSSTVRQFTVPDNIEAVLGHFDGDKKWYVRYRTYQNSVELDPSRQNSLMARFKTIAAKEDGPTKAAWVEDKFRSAPRLGFTTEMRTVAPSFADELRKTTATFGANSEFAREAQAKLDALSDPRSLVHQEIAYIMGNRRVNLFQLAQLLDLSEEDLKGLQGIRQQSLARRAAWVKQYHGHKLVQPGFQRAYQEALAGLTPVVTRRLGGGRLQSLLTRFGLPHLSTHLDLNKVMESAQSIDSTVKAWGLHEDPELIQAFDDFMTVSTKGDPLARQGKLDVINEIIARKLGDREEAFQDWRSGTRLYGGRPPSMGGRSYAPIPTAYIGDKVSSLQSGLANDITEFSQSATKLPPNIQKAVKDLLEHRQAAEWVYKDTIDPIAKMLVNTHPGMRLEQALQEAVQSDAGRVAQEAWLNQDAHFSDEMRNLAPQGLMRPTPALDTQLMNFGSLHSSAQEALIYQSPFLKTMERWQDKLRLDWLNLRWKQLVLAKISTSLKITAADESIRVFANLVMGGHHVQAARYLKDMAYGIPAAGLRGVGQLGEKATGRELKALTSRNVKNFPPEVMSQISQMFHLTRGNDWAPIVPSMTTEYRAKLPDFIQNHLGASHVSQEFLKGMQGHVLINAHRGNVPAFVIDMARDGHLEQASAWIEKHLPGVDLHDPQRMAEYESLLKQGLDAKDAEAVSLLYHIDSHLPALSKQLKAQAGLATGSPLQELVDLTRPLDAATGRAAARRRMTDFITRAEPWDIPAFNNLPKHIKDAVRKASALRHAHNIDDELVKREGDQFWQTTAKWVNFMDQWLAYLTEHPQINNWAVKGAVDPKEMKAMLGRGQQLMDAQLPIFPSHLSGPQSNTALGRMMDSGFDKLMGHTTEPMVNYARGTGWEVMRDLERSNIERYHGVERDPTTGASTHPLWTDQRIEREASSKAIHWIQKNTYQGQRTVLAASLRNVFPFWAATANMDRFWLRELAMHPHWQTFAAESMNEIDKANANGGMRIPLPYLGKVLQQLHLSDSSDFTIDPAQATFVTADGVGSFAPGLGPAFSTVLDTAATYDPHVADAMKGIPVFGEIYGQHVYTDGAQLIPSWLSQLGEAAAEKVTGHTVALPGLTPSQQRMDSQKATIMRKQEGEFLQGQGDQPTDQSVGGEQSSDLLSTALLGFFLPVAPRSDNPLQDQVNTAQQQWDQAQTTADKQAVVAQNPTVAPLLQYFDRNTPEEDQVDPATGQTIPGRRTIAARNPWVLAYGESKYVSGGPGQVYQTPAEIRARIDKGTLHYLDPETFVANVQKQQDFNYAWEAYSAIRNQELNFYASTGVSPQSSEAKAYRAQYYDPQVLLLEQQNPAWADQFIKQNRQDILGLAETTRPIRSLASWEVIPRMGELETPKTQAWRSAISEIQTHADSLRELRASGGGTKADVQVIMNDLNAKLSTLADGNPSFATELSAFSYLKADDLVNFQAEEATLAAQQAQGGVQ